MNCAWCSLENATCANTSPDGSLYALAVSDQYDGDNLYAGSLSGGQANLFTKLTPLYDGLIGWTKV